MAHSGVSHQLEETTMAGTKSRANRASMGKALSAVGEGLLGGSSTGAAAGKAIGKGLRRQVDKQRDPMGGRRKADRER